MRLHRTIEQAPATAVDGVVLRGRDEHVEAQVATLERSAEGNAQQVCHVRALTRSLVPTAPALIAQKLMCVVHKLKSL